MFPPIRVCFNRPYREPGNRNECTGPDRVHKFDAMAPPFSQSASVSRGCLNEVVRRIDFDGFVDDTTTSCKSYSDDSEDEKESDTLQLALEKRNAEILKNSKLARLNKRKQGRPTFASKKLQTTRVFSGDTTMSCLWTMGIGYYICFADADVDIESVKIDELVYDNGRDQELYFTPWWMYVTQYYAPIWARETWNKGGSEDGWPNCTICYTPQKDHVLVYGPMELDSEGSPNAGCYFVKKVHKFIGRMFGDGDEYPEIQNFPVVYWGNLADNK